MKSVRLLPVVIFAALALLLFKGIGLVTNGGYVLTGSTEVFAAGASGGHATPAGEPAADLGGGMPEEVEIADTSPTLDDTAPTMAANTVPAVGHGETTEPAHGSSAEEGADAAHGSSEGEHGESSAPVAETACPTTEHASSAEGDHSTPETPLPADCLPSEVPVNEHGDALPLIKDGTGKIVPMEATGDASEEALIARLSDRRAELDRREADIGMRMALLEAAEKRLEERTQELAALEARVAQLVDEKQAAEEAGFKAVVSMYETMKPKDAAKIFDTLKLSVLLKVARSMSPRKMSPILAAMSAEPAQQLTMAMAVTESTDVVADAGENLAALPQIVGQ